MTKSLMRLKYFTSHSLYKNKSNMNNESLLNIIFSFKTLVVLFILNEKNYNRWIELSACEKMIKLYIFVWNSLKGFSIKAITKCMKALYIHCIYNCYFSFYFGNLLWTGKCKPFWIIYVRVIDKILFFNSIAGNFQDLVSAYILP